MPRTTGVLVLAVSALAILSVCSAVAPVEVQPAPQVEQVRAITWTRCELDQTAQCATVPMPVDWAKPEGETFGLAVARRKATDPARRIGVLMLNPGGPGGSGVEFAVQNDHYFDDEILARFDIVGFDPRGVGGSSAVQCSSAAQAKAPTRQPGNQAEFDQLAAFNRELRADCRDHTGPVFEHLDTLSVVRDMDMLRAELGEDKISTYGLSYGTLIGQEYAEKFGDRLRAMVLDANMDHSLDTRGYLTTGAAAVEDSLAEFAKWCDQDTGCAVHGRSVPQLVDALTADPAHEGRAVEVVYGALEDANWPALAAFLEDPQFDVEEGTASLAQHAIICQDWQFRPRDYEELAGLMKAERQVAPTVRFSFENRDNVLGCVGLPDQTGNPQHALRFHNGTPPVLMVNSRHDPTTPYAWAQNVNRQTSAYTRLVTYDGWGHIAFHRSDCVQAAANSYLVSTALPEDLRCPVAKPNP